jgi:hypothetical protein
MNSRSRRRVVALAAGCAGVFAWSLAQADIYTWIDASGNLNVSNQPPPEGVRVTSVYREDPAARAHAEAARAASARDELRALNARVAELERALEKAREEPPRQPEPAPLAYAPAPPPPAAYASAMAQTIIAQPAPSYPPYLAGYDCAWVGCFSPGAFGFYPSGVVVVNAPGTAHAHPPRRPEPVRNPQPRIPRPVGELPDPPNLFPGTGR